MGAIGIHDPDSPEAANEFRPVVPTGIRDVILRALNRPVAGSPAVGSPADPGAARLRPTVCSLDCWLRRSQHGTPLRDARHSPSACALRLADAHGSRARRTAPSPNRLDAQPCGRCVARCAIRWPVWSRSWSVPVVMTAASIGAAKGGGYARYLESKTVEPERGDYYLTPDGEPTQAPGQWLASPDTLARLGIEGSTVEGRDFIALMEGRIPGREWLRRAGSNGGRAAGST